MLAPQLNNNRGYSYLLAHIYTLRFFCFVVVVLSNTCGPFGRENNLKSKKIKGNNLEKYLHMYIFVFLATFSLRPVWQELVG